MDVRLPDGTVVKNVPDGITQSALMASVGRMRGSTRSPDALDNPNMATEGMSGTDKFLAGAGKAFADVGRGLSQITGDMPQSRIDEARARDKPLMDTGAGTAGNVVGNVAAAVPAAMIPGAGSVLGGAMISGGLGAAQPVATGESRGNNAATAALLGGAMQGAINAAPAIGSGIRHVYRGAVEPFFQGGRNAAEGRAYNAVAGDRVKEIVQALRNEPSAVPGYQSTAAERVATLPPSTMQAGQAEFAGLQANTAPSAPSIGSAVTQSQNKALADHLRAFGGDKASLQAAVDARNALTGPMRETALENANIAGVKVPELQGRLNKQGESLVSALQTQGQLQSDAAQLRQLAEGNGTGNRAQIVSSTPNGNYPTERAINTSSSQPTNNPPQLSAITPYLRSAAESEKAAGEVAGIAANRRAQAGLTQYQLDSLAAHGHYPLDANKVVGSIDRMLATPGDRAVTLNQKILSAVRDKIAGMADKNGVINSRDLYAIRKTDINDVVDSLTKDMGASTKNRAATLVSSIKSDIDNAIEAAGGTGWKDYLKTYAEKSKGIDQMKIGQALEEKLTGALQGDAAIRPQAYASALRDSANVAQKTSGAPRYTALEDALTPQNMQNVNNIGSTLANQAMAKQLSMAGSTRAAALTGAPDIVVPPTLSRTGMALRFAARLLEGKGTSKVDQEMARDMLTNPSQVSKLMEDAMRRAKTNEQMVRALRKYSPLATQGAVQAQGQ